MPMYVSMVNVGKLTCATVAGLAVGTYLERRRRSGDVSDGVTKAPGLPMFGTVSAAVAFSSPAQDGALVAAKPFAMQQQKAARTGQIMRFGFPGLDNIRSHRYKNDRATPIYASCY